MQIPEGWKTQSKPIAKSKPRESKKKAPSAGEAILCRHLDALKIEYEQEFKFHPERKWRADFRIEGYPILVEVEGGVFINGGHSRGKAYTNNCEKYSHMAIDGWLLIRATTDQVKSGQCIHWIEQTIEKLKDKK